jgi:hypothetical protein
VQFPPHKPVGVASAGPFPDALSADVARLNRVTKLVDDLQAEVASWKRRNPIALSRRSDIEFRRHRWIVAISPAPLEDWGACVGEVLHGLRTVLDHLVYAAAIQYTGQDPPPAARQLGFPIATTPEQFTRAAARVLQPLGELAPGFVEAIESVQPYHDGEGGLLDEHLAKAQGLALLRDLNDQDKHRAVHAVHISFPGSSARFVDAHGSLSNFQFKLGPASDGDVATAVDTSLPSPRISAMFDAPFEVSLLGLPYDVVTNLRALHSMTWTVLGGIARVVWNVSL